MSLVRFRDQAPSPLCAGQGPAEHQQAPRAARAEAEDLLARGADAIALGRSAIVNPDWPLRVADDAWEPKRPPVTIGELRERGLGPAFAEYMRNWEGFVSVD